MTNVDGLHARLDRFQEHVDEKFEEVNGQLDRMEGLLRIIANSLNINVEQVHDDLTVMVFEDHGMGIAA